MVRGKFAIRMAIWMANPVACHPDHDGHPDGELARRGNRYYLISGGDSTEVEMITQA